MKEVGEAPNISAIARQFKVKRAFVTKWVDRYQMARSLAGTRFKSIDELKEGIQKAWDDIPISTMKKLVGGMHRRMRKVIQEDGRRISA